MESKNKVYTSPFTFNTYTITKFLGTQGFGDTYLAQDSNGKQVNLKVSKLKVNESEILEIERGFNNEFAQTSRLKHPNIIQSQECFFDQQHQQFVLVSEYMVNGSLSNYIDQVGQLNQPLTTDEQMNMIRQLIHGLYTLHQLGVAHRSFTTSNIMLDSEKNVKIGGLGGTYKQSLSANSTPRGSHLAKNSSKSIPFDFELPAPEHLNETYTGYQTLLARQTDLYCLGLVMYEILFYKNIFENNDNYFQVCVKGDLDNYVEEFFKQDNFRGYQNETLVIKSLLKQDPRSRMSLKDAASFLNFNINWDYDTFIYKRPSEYEQEIKELSSKHEEEDSLFLQQLSAGENEFPLQDLIKQFKILQNSLLEKTSQVDKKQDQIKNLNNFLLQKTESEKSLRSNISKQQELIKGKDQKLEKQHQEIEKLSTENLKLTSNNKNLKSDEQKYEDRITELQREISEKTKYYEESLNKLQQMLQNGLEEKSNLGNQIIELQQKIERLGHDTMTDVKDHLQPYIKFIEIDGNRIFLENLRVQTLREAKKVIVSAKDTCFDDNFMLYLSKVLCHCEQAYLLQITNSKTKVTSTGLQSLSGAISQCQKIETLSIKLDGNNEDCQNVIKDSGLKSIASAIKNCRELSTLEIYLSGNYCENVITDSGLESLVGELGNLSHLTRLMLYFGGDLCTNYISDNGVLQLAKCVKKLEYLNVLEISFFGNMSSKKISDLGVAQLVSSLKGCQYLSELFLNFCEHFKASTVSYKSLFKDLKVDQKTINF